MSTKVSDMNQLFSSVNVHSTNAAKNNTKKISVQFSELLSQNAALNTPLGTEKDANQGKLSSIGQEYSQFQSKDKTIQTSTPKTLDQKATEILEKVSDYSDKVKDVLKDELGVTDEQIETALETLGLQYVDLLNPNNLAQLVSELTGEDMTNLICNESFQNIMQNVGTISQELLLELGISKEEFNDLCSLMIKNQDSAEAPVADDTGEVQLIENGTDNSANIATNTDDVVNDGTVKNADVLASQETQETTSQETVLTAVLDDENPSEASEKQNSDLMTQTEVSDGTEEAIIVNPENEAGTEKGFSQNQQESQQNLTQTNPGMMTQQPVSTEPIMMGPTEFAQTYQQAMDIQKVIDQIVESARVTISNDTTKMEMQLNPENLGKIYLEISSKEGNVSAKLVAQNEAVKEALQTQLADLKQNLNQAGVKVDAVEVTVSSHEFEKNLDQNAKQQEQLGEQQESQEQSGRRNRRNINLNSLDDLSGIMSEEENLVAQIMQDNGNSMDLKA